MEEAVPQVHFVMSKDVARSTAYRKIFTAPDDSSTLTAAHLVTEAQLYRSIQLNVANPAALDDIRWTYRETLAIAQSLRKPKGDGEDWLWVTLRCLNNIRNHLAHNIEVVDLSEQILAMYQAAGNHIDVHTTGADSEERERNRLKYFLLILCGVVQLLQDPMARV